MENSRNIVQQWFEYVWNRNDSSYIDKMLAEDCEITGLRSEPIRSAEEFHLFHKQMNTVLGDMQVDVTHLLEKEDLYSGFISVSAIHKMSNKPVKFSSSFYGSLKDGRIYKSVNLVDYTTLLVQIGVLDSETLQQALSGE